VGSAHWPLKSAPECQHWILESKGFGGGVPLNTETTAVKLTSGLHPEIGGAEPPRATIASWRNQERAGL
jgi:hypothetical protein